MPIIKQNDIIDVIYDTICGYEPEEAYKILELYQAKQLIPIEWIKEHYGWLTMAGEIIKDWEKHESRDTESTK